MSIGEATLQPYNRSKPTIVITAIEVTDETTPKVKVVWSRKLVNGTFSVDAAAGTVTTVPAALKIKGSFLDPGREQRSTTSRSSHGRRESKAPLGLTAAFDGIAMAETYYLRPA